jgi:5-methylcytosine-specific restriction endonuclease McrA
MSRRRACVVCGRTFQPTPDNPSRCERHRIPKVNRDRTYRNLSAAVIAAATHCGICGQPFTDPTDPPVVDHIISRAHGGNDDPTNLQAAHRTCNGRKGATLGNTGAWGAGGASKNE